jgi:hypothetical protein
MPDTKTDKTVMETAICSSITRAAGLGDHFWRADLRNVAVMAMGSDQDQSLNRPKGKGKAVTPGMHKVFLSVILHFIESEKSFSREIFSCQLERKRKGEYANGIRQCMHETNESPCSFVDKEYY